MAAVPMVGMFGLGGTQGSPLSSHQAALEAIGADRLVVGHTPTPNRRVLQRFDGKLIEIDTGMLNDYYKFSCNALVLDGDKLAVLNQRGGEMTVPADHPRNVGTRPGRMSADAPGVSMAAAISSRPRPSSR